MVNKVSKRLHNKRGVVGDGMLLTDEMIRAAARDEGNRNMRAHGRRTWSRADYNVAARAYKRLSSQPKTALLPGGKHE